MNYQQFWKNNSFAVIGDSRKKKFPRLTYGKLKQRGKDVFAVDPGAETVDGDRAYDDLSALPQPVDAVVLEVPAGEAEEWVVAVADAGISNLWIHQHCDTPEAISLAGDRGIELYYGTCAVMYLSEGFSIHAFHGWINRRLGKY